MKCNKIGTSYILKILNACASGKEQGPAQRQIPVPSRITQANNI